MYLSRLILNPRSRAVRRDLADVQQLHRTLMNAFPDTEDKTAARRRLGVLYRLESPPLTSQLQLLVQSRIAPDWTGLDPDYLASVVRSVSLKRVDDLYAAIQEGQLLRFRLRANATKKVDTKSAPDGRKRNGRRVPLRGEEAVLAWLHRKAEQGGFRLIAVQYAPSVLDVRTQQTRQVARLTGQHQQGPLTIDSVLYDGRLQVTQPERFRETLANGVGPAKAYGCGLLSVAPMEQSAATARYRVG